MKPIYLLLFTTVYFLSSLTYAQTINNNRDLIEKAQGELEPAIMAFSNCIVTSDTKICIDNLTYNATTDYKKYLVAGMLYEMDTSQSFRLHKEAYLSNPQERNFILEYAIELHRNRQYAEAAKLYETYSANIKNDSRIYVWLSDCYINIGETNKSIINWQRADYSHNHTNIDLAINIIYGNTSQIASRNNYKTEIAQGKISSFFPLIFLDENWKFDRWNKGVQKYFLADDIKLAKNKLDSNSNDLKILEAYIAIKQFEKGTGKAQEIKKILLKNSIILDNKPIPQFGNMASDLLRICFTNGLLIEEKFYQLRGQELLDLANKTKDKEVLNIYAYLQAKVDGRVKPEIDLLGWKEYKDERFAVSYFMGKADKNNYDDKELVQALIDFPNSSKLYWVKTKCAKIEGRILKPHLIELIKTEFKTLGSDENHFSNKLNSYFGILANEN